MVPVHEETEKSINMLSNKSSRNMNETVKEEIEQMDKGEAEPLQNYLRLYYNVLRRHDLLETSKTREETLNTAIDLLKTDHPEFNPKINWGLLDASKYETDNDRILDEVRLKAEILRKKKMRKATLLSVMRVGSTLMLFLAIGLLQFSFSLYLFSLIVGCTILGISTFLERGT